MPSQWQTASLIVGIFATFASAADQGLLPYTIAIPRIEEGDSLRLAAFELLRYDSNFFHLPDGVAPGDGKSRAALTSTSGVGIGLDKSYGQQRIVLDASSYHDDYPRASNLNFTSYQIKATYYWHFTSDISGSVHFDRSYLPTDYEYIGFQTRPNPRTNQYLQASIDWRAGAGLHPRLSLTEADYKSVTPSFQLQNSRSHYVEASAIYRLPSKNTLEAYVDAGRGKSRLTSDQQTNIGNGGETQRYGIRAHWADGDFLSIDGDIGHLSQQNNNDSRRNYGGLIGNLTMFYAVTGRTQIFIAASQNIYSAQTDFSSYFVEDDVNFGFLYLLTGKLTFRPSYTVRRQRYHGALVQPDTPLREISRYTTLELDWAAARWLDLSLAVTHSSRAATEPVLNFGDQSVSAFVRLKF